MASTDVSEQREQPLADYREKQHVPAGGLSSDRTQWIHARPTFFLPVKVLRQVFRGKLVAGLRDAFRQGPTHVSRRAPDARA